MLEKDLTTSEVAEQLRCSRENIYELIEKGELIAYGLSMPKFKNGKRVRTHYRIAPQEVINYKKRAAICASLSTGDIGTSTLTESVHLSLLPTGF